jgi:hypothetical protein
MVMPYLVIDRSGNAVDINHTEPPTCHDHYRTCHGCPTAWQNTGATREQMVPYIGRQKDCRNSPKPPAFKHGVYHSST